MLHAVLSSGVLPKSHLFYLLLDLFLRSALHLCFHGPEGETCEWPALVSFTKTMFLHFGQSSVNLMTALGNMDCGRQGKIITAGEYLARYNITHFSVRSPQFSTPAANLESSVEIVDVLNSLEAVKRRPHVSDASFRGHCVCLSSDEMNSREHFLITETYTHTQTHTHTHCS